MCQSFASNDCSVVLDTWCIFFSKIYETNFSSVPCNSYRSDNVRNVGMLKRHVLVMMPKASWSYVLWTITVLIYFAITRAKSVYLTVIEIQAHSCYIKSLSLTLAWLNKCMLSAIYKSIETCIQSLDQEIICLQKSIILLIQYFSYKSLNLCCLFNNTN